MTRKIKAKKQSKTAENNKNITGYNLVMPCRQYKGMLESYTEVDGKIVYKTFSSSLRALIERDRLAAKGLYLVIEPIREI